jgi:hypothetical protein
MKNGPLSNGLSMRRGNFLKEAHSALFTSSAWVQVTQCGPSCTTDKRESLISLALPEITVMTMRGHVTVYR